MNRSSRNTKLTVIVTLLLLSVCVVGCKTGKGCDCPTFGKSDTQKINRF